VKSSDGAVTIGEVAFGTADAIVAPPRGLNFWLVADTHFGHDNIVAFSARPDNHDDLMARRWREYIDDDDVVLHLGDLCWCWDDKQAWFEQTIAPQLTGRKYMIVGNHDLESADFYARCGFRLIEAFAIDTPEGWRIRFSHNPNEDPPRYPQTINAHGHIHIQLMPNLRHLNLCVEWTDYGPVRARGAISERIDQLKDGFIATTIPIPYDQWQVQEYGEPRYRSDVERWPDSPDQRRVAREQYTKYRLNAPRPLRAQQSVAS
jgi:calcineurin-like phosphoesterase family protein